MQRPKTEIPVYSVSRGGMYRVLEVTTLSLLMAAALFGVFHLPASPAAVFRRTDHLSIGAGRSHANNTATEYRQRNTG